MMVVHHSSSEMESVPLKSLQRAAKQTFFLLHNAQDLLLLRGPEIPEQYRKYYD